MSVKMVRNLLASMIPITIPIIGIFGAINIYKHYKTNKKNKEINRLAFLKHNLIKLLNLPRNPPLFFIVAIRAIKSLFVKLKIINKKFGNVTQIELFTIIAIKPSNFINEQRTNVDKMIIPLLIK